MGEPATSGSLDRDGVTRLLIEHQALLRAYVGAIVRNRDLVEEALQETAVVIMQRAEQATDRTRFAAWARGVARRVALALARKRGRVRAVDPRLLDLTEADWNSYDTATLRARRTALNGCIESLSPTSRKLLEMRYERKMGGKDIAKALKRSLGGMYTALSKIHKSLSDCVRGRLATEDIG